MYPNIAAMGIEQLRQTLYRAHAELQRLQNENSLMQARLTIADLKLSRYATASRHLSALLRTQAE